MKKIERNAGLWLLVALAPLWIGARDCETAVVGTRGTCELDGELIAVGDEVESGCNTCVCDAPDSLICTRLTCPSGGCEHAGEHHAVGASFPAGDGCNTCSCTQAGEVLCTEIGCAPGDGCDYDGEHYAVGAGFPSSDGCNECGCQPDGMVACTARACAPGGCEHAGTHHASGTSFPAGDGCNSCSCTDDGNVACTDIACSPGGCDYGGEHRAAGDSFTDTDGCNTCVCQEDGMVACTASVCPPNGCVMGDTVFPMPASVVCEDGCNQCVCNGQWGSTLIACPALRQAEVCDGPPPANRLDASKLYKSGHALALTLRYSGGCAQHAFKLCFSELFAESDPVQTSIWVEDIGEPDSCDAALTEEVVFDLTPILVRYNDVYQTTSGTVVLNLDDEQVRYEWAAL